MELIKETLVNFVWDVMNILLVALAGVVAVWVGVIVDKIKNKLFELADTKLKKDIVEAIVRTVEQLAKDGKMIGEQKFKLAVEKADIALKEKGLSYTDNELQLLIESAVNEFTNKS